MKVIDHEPQMWFLLQDINELFLDVACSHSFIEYDFLIALDEEETRRYKDGGHDYLNRLAEEINFSAPGVQSSFSPYKTRNIHQLRGDDVMVAVREWQNSH